MYMEKRCVVEIVFMGMESVWSRERADLLLYVIFHFYIMFDFNKRWWLYIKVSFIKKKN